MLPANILLVFVLDLVFGDPSWFPHPVRVIGWLIGLLDRALNRPAIGNVVRFAAGAFTALAVVLLSYVLVDLAVYLVTARLGRVAGWLLTLAIGYTCLSTRGLGDAARAVMLPLGTGDLPSARLALSMIVGRDTAYLDGDEVARGAIETVAENTSDGVVAPLFYLAVGGPALAVAYKAINTLDSMIGYRSEKYLHFGKVAARLDDAANFIPARLAGLLVVAASWLLSLKWLRYSWRESWRVLVRDRGNHTSPNSGYPEAAVAGALSVRLGGESNYFGVKSVKPFIGDIGEKLTAGKVRDGVRLMYMTSALGAIFCSTLSGTMRALGY